MFGIDFVEQALKVEPLVVGKAREPEFTGFSIDSRAIEPGQCFVGIKGENFDGNEFAGEVSEKGVGVFILSKHHAHKVMRKIQSGYVFIVPDTVKALGDLARRYKKQIFAPVVAVTGSSGKTTTRHLITEILSVKYNVHTARKNFNTEVGLPLSILEAPVDTHIMVMEMGMNHPGEIGRLSSIAEPLVGVVTNIGYAHIGMFGNLESIADAKSEIYYGINKRGYIFLNREDDFFPYFKQKSPVEVFDYSKSDLEIVEDRHVEGYELKYENMKFKFCLPGEYNLSNLSAAVKVGEFFKVAPKDIVRAAKNFNPVGGRSNTIKGKKALIIDDCYNANPSSMMAALGLLSRAPGKRIAVISDMLELGHLSHKLHKMIADYLIENNAADSIYGYGKFTKDIIEKVDKAGFDGKWFDNRQNLIDYTLDNVKSGDTVLVKASNGMKLSEVVEALKK